MVKQAGLLIAQGIVGQNELVDDIIHFLAIVMKFGVLCVEGPLHVKAIQPDLPGIDFLVPVDSAAGARLIDKLLAKDVLGLLEPLLPAFCIKRKEGTAGIDLVQVVLPFPIGCDRSILTYELIVHRVDPGIDGLVFVVLGTLQRGIKHKTVLVMPQHHTGLIVAFNTLGHCQGQWKAVLSHKVITPL